MVKRATNNPLFSPSQTKAKQSKLPERASANGSTNGSVSIDDVVQKARSVANFPGLSVEFKTTLELLLVIVSQQQEEINKLRQLVADVAADLRPSRPAEDPAEAKERARAIVVVGLPETEGKPSVRQAGDKAKLIDLFDELDTEATIVATYRMGVKNDGKPRLTKVILGTSGQQHGVIGAAKKLKNTVKFKGVFLRPSMTKEERDEDAKLRKELGQRRQNGERVYIRGWPGQKREIVVISNQGN